MATVYHDGGACPGDCDAHVVFHPAYNGTWAASYNGGKCEWGGPCTICFRKEAGSCLTTTYRGGGPSLGRFDFTPAFLEENCHKEDLPNELSSMCGWINRRINGYASERINCFTVPERAECVDVIAAANAVRKQDIPAFVQCEKMGEKAYNAAQPDATTRRIYGCRYSKLITGGPNSKGERWHELLPAACGRDGYVGRFGTDCCTSNLYQAAAFHPECTAFFPKRQVATPE